MNTASIVYIPPSNFKNTIVFVDNLANNPPKGPLIILSDANYKTTFPDALHVALSIPPERLDVHRLNPDCGISNALFITAMRKAKEFDLSHVLYVESDCRFSAPGWDEKVFDEFFSLPFPAVAAGTLMAWNIFNGGLPWINRLRTLFNETSDYPCPVHVYGSFPFERDGKIVACNPTIFPNGAGTVMSVDWMWELFHGFDNMIDIATGANRDGKAFDWQIGSRVRDRFGAHSFDLFAHLKTVCSCYGDLALPLEYRMALLRNKSVAISHQHKGKEML